MMAAGLLIGLILFYLFETDGLFQYSKVLRIKLPYVLEYQKILDSGGSVRYLDFIRGIYNNSFLAKLLTCPICLSFYLSAGFSLIRWNIFEYPAVHSLGLAWYFGLKILAKTSN